MHVSFKDWWRVDLKFITEGDEEEYYIIEGVTKWLLKNNGWKNIQNSLHGMVIFLWILPSCC